MSYFLIPLCDWSHITVICHLTTVTFSSLFTDEEIQMIRNVTFHNVLVAVTSAEASDIQNNVFFWRDGKMCLLYLFHEHATIYLESVMFKEWINKRVSLIPQVTLVLNPHSWIRQCSIPALMLPNLITLMGAKLALGYSSWFCSSFLLVSIILTNPFFLHGNDTRSTHQQARCETDNQLWLLSQLVF